jgi:hypothetical protein
MSRFFRTWMLFAIALGLSAPLPARSDVAQRTPILLFGGPDFEHFLGCLNCERSEAFSVWNETVDYGSTTHPHSIWNRNGVYGSPSSPWSPWNPSATTPPIAVDRVGNVYGHFTRNLSDPNRVRRQESHVARPDFERLVWLLENYDWIIAHLDEARSVLRE